MSQPPPDDAEHVLSVSELNGAIKEVLEGAFPAVWVTGEISNFSRPQSGHCYLTLKDDQAQIRAVLWRMTASRVQCDLHDGLEVVCRGYLDLYAARGSYQLVIQSIQPKGMGALEQRLRRLRDKLAAEGLFDRERKRELPMFPARVAFVTSPSGAAVRDFLEVLRRRWCGVDVMVVPVRVQGDGAAAEIAAAIEQVNRLSCPVDVLVVGRGGGSLEDLWAFNEEVVVRAIHASRIPVISAVGHEIDVTLSDLVADVRALTPSEAAERLVPAADEVQQGLFGLAIRLRNALRSQLASGRSQLMALEARRPLRRPFERLHDHARRLDETQSRAARAVRQRLTQSRSRLTSLQDRLESLNPTAVLARGYSITLRENSGELITDSEQLAAGETIVTRFARGEARSRVE